MRRVLCFTLIELLVVVAVIAILIAMLLPALNLAKDAARTARCQSNQKQIYIASHLYADDFRGFLPYVVKKWQDSPGKWDYWSTILMGTGEELDYTNYAGAAEIFHCPSRINHATWRGDYGMNVRMLNDLPSTHYQTGNTTNPEELYLFGDTIQTGNYYQLIQFSSGFIHNLDRNTNITFHDGHVTPGEDYARVKFTGGPPNWKNGG